MEDRNGLSRQSSALWRCFRNVDFEEEDVWDVLKERTTSITSDHKFNDSLYESSSSVSGHHFPSAARIIPRPNHSRSRSRSSSGNSSYNSKTPCETQNALQSAPLPIPQWFNTKGKNPRKASKHDSRNDNDEDEEEDDDDDGDDDDDDDEEYENKVPPHELIAKRLAKTQISSFSVFEGVGRTLKGRDLSKVRNAVLTKTGFLESL